ncbi:MAG: hypothetical protein HY275_04815 [Gemmatimonadetes bacterium]|nr:hypothetical protein [Gemmatimonadota bacterium]
MFDQMSPDAHDQHAMRVIHYTCAVIALSFVGFGIFAITTRMGAGAPPSSVTYGTEKPHKASTVIGD